ncbi:MAG: PLP-dependent aminotransferase family protein [Thermoflexales bacterium]|nr:PLP-dependent aminotransferase family protein [Thermoflexales bacterium]
MTTPWAHRYALRTHGMGSSAIRELLKLTQQPDLISFAGGLPAPEMFPIAQIKTAADTVLTEVGAQALQYSTTEGYNPLRELLVRQMARYGIKVGIDNIVITSGSQQALDLIGKLLINPGDRILTENPSYLGALQAFTAYQAQYVTVPIDDDGLQVSNLEAALRSGPKFMYILPNFQNPTGVTLSLTRRYDLIALAEEYGIPIVEDDPYGQLRYEGEHLKPLVVLDSEYEGCEGDGGYTGNVIYTSTFSKTLAPGLRLGWIVAPRDVVSKLVQMKQGTDLHTSSFDQMVAYEVARDGFLDKHIRLIRETYGHRRDVMLNAMEQYFPSEVRWTRPAGGLFLWVTTPESINTAELLKDAIAQKVAFVPGYSFHPNGGGHNTMRLNFSNAKDEMIVEGIRRMSVALKQRLAHNSPVFSAN